MQRRRLHNDGERGRWSPRWQLAAWAAAIAVGWLGILPHVARTDGVQRMIERNESLGIDPSAKFYSELPAMPAILQHWEDDRGRRRTSQSGDAM